MPPERTQSLPGSSRESSTEPMDTDVARRPSEEIYQRIRQQAGLSRSGSAGDVTLLPEPTRVITWERFTHSGGMGEQTQVVASNTRDHPIWDKDTTAGAVGGATERLKDLCKQLGLAVPTELQPRQRVEAPEYPPPPLPLRFPSRQEEQWQQAQSTLQPGT